MAGAVDICNKALALLGQGPIASLDDQTVQAVVMKAWYEPAKRQVLRMYEWNCAKREEDGVVDESGPNNDCWDYMFQHPTDAIRIIELVEAKEVTSTHVGDVAPWPNLSAEDAEISGTGTVT